MRGMACAQLYIVDLLSLFVSQIRVFLPSLRLSYSRDLGRIYDSNWRKASRITGLDPNYAIDCDEWTDDSVLRQILEISNQKPSPVSFSIINYQRIYLKLVEILLSGATSCLILFANPFV